MTRMFIVTSVIVVPGMSGVIYGRVLLVPRQLMPGMLLMVVFMATLWLTGLAGRGNAILTGAGITCLLYLGSQSGLACLLRVIAEVRDAARAIQVYAADPQKPPEEAFGCGEVTSTVATFEGHFEDTLSRLGVMMLMLRHIVLLPFTVEVAYSASVKQDVSD